MTQNDRKVLESILLLADEPVPSGLMGEVLERPRAEIEATLTALAESYRQEDRGFVLRNVAGGWRLYTDPECAQWLERFVTRHAHTRLTAAALEVLAIVAYRQPISRSQIAEIRGIDSDGVVKTLLQRSLIVESGHDSGPGSPVLFTVSPVFLERLGLNSVADLPPLAEFMPDAEAVEDMEAKLSPGTD
ncbi:MAG: segregation and condensation protein [Actinomycetota bacterium]|nr:segregation and condensation protein [Actinomycetota bacterium]